MMFAALLALALPGAAQTPLMPGSLGPLLGGVPSGTATLEELALSLDQTIDRGLQHNLGLLLSEQRVQYARGERAESLSDRLPHLDARFAATRQKISLDAFGFTGLPGLPTLIGPFNVVDARVSVSESLLDFEALQKDHEKQEQLVAARHSYADTRDLVILVCGNLYVQALAEQSRIEAAKAELKTAEALRQLASDRKQAGLVPTIDLLRAEVEQKARQQQLIVAENRLARAKLVLARAIGLPAGQAFRLSDRMSEAPPPPVEVEVALAKAFESRSDWQAAQAELRAAEAARRAARGRGLPSLLLNADYGAIGQTLGGSNATYTLGAALKIPLFEGGKVHGKVLEADSDLATRRAMLEDFRARIDFEVRSAGLDLAAAGERVLVAKDALGLAGEQLQQAQDRFEAGVANNIDVVQAQEALASSNESFIASLYDQSLARASMARATGTATAAYKELVRGE
jgi:outer membrane protein TolC